MDSSKESQSKDDNIVKVPSEERNLMMSFGNLQITEDGNNNGRNQATIEDEIDEMPDEVQNIDSIRQDNLVSLYYGEERDHGVTQSKRQPRLTAKGKQFKLDTLESR